MGMYFDFPVYADEEMKDFKAKHLGNFDAHVVDMGTGASHTGILNVATNGQYEDHKDRFRDPRPGHEGEKIFPDRAIIATNDLQNYSDGKLIAMNFNDRNGKFCCSYLGDYETIVNNNKEDVQQRQQAMGPENKRPDPGLKR